MILDSGRKSIPKNYYQNIREIVTYTTYPKNDDPKILYISENVKSVDGDAFVECVNLKKIDLCKINEIKRFAFYHCIALKNVNLSEVISIDIYAFRGCSNLIEINLPKVVVIKSNVFMDVII